VTDGGLRVVDADSPAYRYSSYDTPLWVRENTLPGRWHGRGDGPTQYLSLSTDGAWAELIRAEELTSEDEVAMVSVPLWALEVRQAMVVDYSTFELAEESGFDPAALVSDDHRRCRREGRRLRELGYAGVPATVIAKGAPPPGLLPRVRQLGTQHAGLAAYRGARRRRR
jgi:hypothetical protein